MPHKDREKERAYRAAYYAAHREERRVYSAAYRAAHREEKRAYHAAHPEFATKRAIAASLGISNRSLTKNPEFWKQLHKIRVNLHEAEKAIKCRKTRVKSHSRNSTRNRKPSLTLRGTAKPRRRACATS